MQYWLQEHFNQPIIIMIKGELVCCNLHGDQTCLLASFIVIKIIIHEHHRDWFLQLFIVISATIEYLMSIVVMIAFDCLIVHCKFGHDWTYNYWLQSLSWLIIWSFDHLIVHRDLCCNQTSNCISWSRLWSIIGSFVMSSVTMEHKIVDHDPHCDQTYLFDVILIADEHAHLRASMQSTWSLAGIVATEFACSWVLLQSNCLLTNIIVIDFAHLSVLSWSNLGSFIAELDRSYTLMQPNIQLRGLSNIIANNL